MGGQDLDGDVTTELRVRAQRIVAVARGIEKRGAGFRVADGAKSR
jgi:hypothetical protein